MLFTRARQKFKGMQKLKLKDWGNTYMEILTKRKLA